MCRQLLIAQEFAFQKAQFNVWSLKWFLLNHVEYAVRSDTFHCSDSVHLGSILSRPGVSAFAAEKPDGCSPTHYLLERGGVESLLNHEIFINPLYLQINML